MKKIGVLGAGQLGRMMGLAGIPLDCRFRFLDPVENSPAKVVGEQIVGPFSQGTHLDQFSSGLDVLTYEFENVPVELARHMAGRLPVYPPPQALEFSQDRLIEKQLFQRLGIQPAPFHALQNLSDLEQIIKAFGFPFIIKTRRMGYDGKGQFLVKSESDAKQVWQDGLGHDLIAEGFVRFQRECSLIAVRSKDARTAFYPLVQNFHHQGILRLSLVPCQKLTGELQSQAVGYVAKILQELDYTGVLAVEFFVADNKLIANEMAPRVHNSGHWTMDGAETSQFENHIRAITGLPLGATNAIGASAMINLIGTVPDVHRMLKIPGSHLHLYGKEPREGRKLGHLNIRADSSEKLIELLQECKDLMPAETFQQFQQTCC